MPLWRFDEEMRTWIEEFIRSATAGANTVARLVTAAVKPAFFDRPKDAAGDVAVDGYDQHRNLPNGISTVDVVFDPGLRRNPDGWRPRHPVARHRTRLRRGQSIRMRSDAGSPGVVGGRARPQGIETHNSESERGMATNPKPDRRTRNSGCNACAHRPRCVPFVPATSRIRYYRGSTAGRQSRPAQSRCCSRDWWRIPRNALRRSGIRK